MGFFTRFAVALLPTLCADLPKGNRQRSASRNRRWRCKGFSGNQVFHSAFQHRGLPHRYVLTRFDLHFRGRSSWSPYRDLQRREHKKCPGTVGRKHHSSSTSPLLVSLFNCLIGSAIKHVRSTTRRWRASRRWPATRGARTASVGLPCSKRSPSSSTTTILPSSLLLIPNYLFCSLTKCPFKVSCCIIG